MIFDCYLINFSNFLSPELAFFGVVVYTRKQMPDLLGQCIKALFRSRFIFGRTHVNNFAKLAMTLFIFKINI
jgi:hypothetical protein